LPKVPNFILQIITSEKQVDELVAEGFDFSYYFSDVDQIKHNMGGKLLLECGFAGKKIVHKQWIALDEKAKMGIDPIPFKIDFKTTACFGGTDTVRKYRGLGVHPYAVNFCYQYISKFGLGVKFSINKNNVISQRSLPKDGFNICAEGRYLKVLWWRRWKERGLTKKKE
jgi:hypothetical protein